MFSNETCISLTTGAAPGIFASALNFFLAAQCLVQTKDWPPDTDLMDSEEFDFVIVGAGTAGSIIASRLSEIESWRILLLEAGGNPPIESDIPRLDQSLYGSKCDWQYSTINNGFTNQANKDGNVKWPRAKMLGGCSSMNVMVYVQGNPCDYQSWYDEGNTEWHPNVVKQYFKKAESLQDPILCKNPSVRNHYGDTGPLVINTFNVSDSDNAQIENIISAWEEIGVPNVDDLNSADNLGSGRMRVTANGGKRVNSATAYLNPIARDRKNLKIVKNAFVTKIVFDGKRAKGVEVVYNDKKIKIKSTHEVILSAGSVNTPKLLMLSGIGPKQHLIAKNIKTVINSPLVGQNLHDHTLIPIPIFANGPDEPDEVIKHLDALRYLYDRQGPLSYHTNYDVAAFYSADPNSPYPDFQGLVVLHKKNEESIKSFASGYVKSVENSILDQSVNKSLFEFMHVLLHPYSRGNISLNSNDPYENPLIYYDNYSDSRDLDLTVVGIKILTRIVHTTNFKRIGAVLGRINFAPCDCYTLDSTEYWRCIAVNMATTIFHPVSTARMGRDINCSVVDSHLRVHGVFGLRVVDASVMPTITRGNTNAPTVMIAERGTDLIKQDYNMLR